MACTCALVGACVCADVCLCGKQTTVGGKKYLGNHIFRRVRPYFVYSWTYLQVQIHCVVSAPVNDGGKGVSDWHKHVCVCLCVCILSVKVVK